jgi:hypothetical protein
MRTTPRTEHHDVSRRGLVRHLEIWEERGLISPAQERAILEFEGGRPEVETRRGVPPITEVIGYLGAALAIAAGVVLIGPRWDEIDHLWRVLGAGGIAAATFVAGWLLRKNTEPAIGRLAAVLWTLSAGAVAATMALLAFDVRADQEPAPWGGFAVGLTVALYGSVLNQLRPSVPLALVVYGGVLGTIGGAGNWAVEAGWTWADENEWWFGVAMLAVSVLWIAAGRVGALPPGNAVIGIGAAGAILAPWFVIPGWTGFGLILGVAVAITMLVASVAWRRTEMLVLGALGLFGYLVGAIVYFLEDTVGLPVALLLCGLVLLGVAIGTARLRRFTAPDALG